MKQQTSALVTLGGLLVVSVFVAFAGAKVEVVGRF